ncbi:M15 family metallopeptidase [Actinosynnema sp. NPDC059797]
MQRVLFPAVGALVVVLSSCGPVAPPGAAGAHGSPGRAAEDGSIAGDGRISPYADHVAIRRMDPGLLAAVREAAEDARAAGIEVGVTSGWRSAEYQQRLLDEAVARYGSVEEARRFVTTPEESAHVSGKAVDIGPTDAADWVGRHGAAYGLCQVYANEMWHFELLTTPGGRCPEQRGDAAG